MNVAHLGRIPAGGLAGFRVSILFGDPILLPVDLHDLIHPPHRK